VLFASYAYRHVVIERERNWIRGVLGRYVSTNVAEAILARPESIGLGGEGREITVVFSDINHFTTLAESNAPEIIMEALNDYFTLMEEIIFRHRGTLKQFVGDEIMVIFGAPEHQEDHRKRAVLAALEMKEALERWSEERKGRGDLYFSAKLGVHSGPVIVGNVGSVHRTEYAAVGDTVNTGARIMGLNKSLGTTLLISDAVYEEVSEIVEVEDKGFHSVKGKGGQLHIYSMTGRKGEVGVAVKANFG
jgi:adenylate cyclase